MTFGVENGVWVVSLGTVLFNALIALAIASWSAKRAYKRGYQAAQIANEALALGRLMESSRERYYAGDALARALEERSGKDPGSLDPSDPAG